MICQAVRYKSLSFVTEKFRRQYKEENRKGKISGSSLSALTSREGECRGCVEADDAREKER